VVGLRRLPKRKRGGRDGGCDGTRSIKDGSFSHQRRFGVVCFGYERKESTRQKKKRPRLRGDPSKRKKRPAVPVHGRSLQGGFKETTCFADGQNQSRKEEAIQQSITRPKRGTTVHPGAVHSFEARERNPWTMVNYAQRKKEKTRKKCGKAGTVTVTQVLSEAQKNNTYAE